VEYPISHVISGMMQGAQLGQMLRHQAMQNEIMDRQRIQLAREQEMEDVRNQMLISQHTRPIEAGMVSEDLPTPSLQQTADPGNPSLSMTPTRGSLRRKADPSRTVKVKTRDGQTIMGELYSPEEQMQRQTAMEANRQHDLASAALPDHINRMLAETRAKQSLADEDLQKNGIELSPEISKTLGVPERKKFQPSQIDEMARAAGSYENYKSIIKQRDAKPTLTVRSSHMTADDNGNQTIIQEMSDGSIVEKQLNAKGKTKSVASTSDESAMDLSETAKDQLAKMFADSGNLPPLGMGKTATKLRSEILNRAAEKYGNIDLATNRAAYEANRRSLANLQKQQDSIEAFESTAGKNLDQFLETAKAVVDSGSPLVNSPLRSINEKLLGADKQTAFKTARQVAVTEIAKVLNNPNGSAALSDSARHEVQDLIGPNATLKQIYSAAKILRTDMHNRRIAGQEQINAINKRLGASSGGASPNLPKGNGKAIDKATATQFYEASGRDPAKAKKMAEEAGWKVN